MPPVTDTNLLKQLRLPQTERNKPFGVHVQSARNQHPHGRLDGVNEQRRMMCGSCTTQALVCDGVSHGFQQELGTRSENGGPPCAAATGNAVTLGDIR